MTYRNIYIETVMNGFVVHIGCQRAVFQNHQAMIAAIGDYYKDPYKEEKTWLDESLVHVGGAVGIAPQLEPSPWFWAMA